MVVWAVHSRRRGRACSVSVPCLQTILVGNYRELTEFRTTRSGTAWPEPNRQLLALPLSSVQAIFGLVLLTVDILHLTSTRCPLRISSTARGSAIVPPGIYPLIEDICAVSGGGGTAFRMALARRYAASPVFRRMLSQLGCFWTIGTLGCASGTAYLVLTLEDIDLAYALGWTLPFAWGMLWSVITITYVRGMLAKEQQVWAQQVLIGLVAP